MTMRGVDKMTGVVIPGSFDPITVGHLDIITRAAAMFDKVYVAVMTNDMSRYAAGAVDKTYLFDREERLEFAAAACAHLDNVKVITAEGLLVDLVDHLGVSAIVKGVRNAADFEYEQKHALWNRAHNPLAETLYLPADPSLAQVSSTAVREVLASGGDLSHLVPPAVAELLKKSDKIR
jgi:pantetheine-phosphate adenylyltransferase